LQDTNIQGARGAGGWAGVLTHLLLNAYEPGDVRKMLLLCLQEQPCMMVDFTYNSRNPRYNYKAYHQHLLMLGKQTRISNI
jgi:hypothetical protein